MSDAAQTTTDPVAAWIAQLDATPHCKVLQVTREAATIRLRTADRETGRLGILTYHLGADGALHVDPRDFYTELQPGRPRAAVRLASAA